MNCVRCEIARVKLRAFVLFHVKQKSAEETALQIIADQSLSGVYWLDGQDLKRSPTMLLFTVGIGDVIANLNRS